MPGIACSLVLRERSTARCGISGVPNNAVIPSAVYVSGWREGRAVLKDIAPGNARPGTADDIYSSSGVVGDGCAVDVNKAAGCRLICLDASGI